MCGVYGAVSLGIEPLQHPEKLERMGRLLSHRGPNAHRIHLTSHAAFGAERLRVIDTSASADQPFTDPSEQVWLVLNGTVYNARELRRRYDTYPFHSKSDAETVLPLYLDKGPDGIADIDGMFALGIYDARTRELVLARDRAGEKPLFYCRVGSEIWFASEIQALLELPLESRRLDPAAVRDFVTLGYVTEPRTMWETIRRVRSGSVASFTSSDHREFRYWQPTTAPREELPLSDAEDRLESLLMNSVRKQQYADVPLGIFTSGGLDSSLLAAFANQTVGADSLKTFSVGFDCEQFDERRYSRTLASYLGATHIEVVADEAALTNALDVIVEHVAEPIADPAILPTYLLAQKARDHVKVVLTGEGADELFGGYPTYLGHQAVNWLHRLPEPVQDALVRTTGKLPTQSDRKVPLEFLLKRFAQGADLPVASRHMVWFGTGMSESVLHPELQDSHYAPPPFPASGDPIDRATYFDYCTYLRDGLLVKVDRATMLCSIEARAPYLDRDLSAFAFALDPSWKVRGISTKWLLKRVGRKWLPRSLVHRRKRGLSVPVAGLLDVSLRALTDRLLASERLQHQGLLFPPVVSQLLYEHRSGRVNHGRALWTLLILERWLDKWVPEIS